MSLEKRFQHWSDITNDTAAAILVLAEVLLRTPDASLTVDEAAKRLKVAKNTVYGMVGRGELKHSRVGRCIRIALTDLHPGRKPDSQDGFNL
jgi:excisionase family DNA binding protein